MGNEISSVERFRFEIYRMYYSMDAGILQKSEVTRRYRKLFGFIVNRSDEFLG